jgi:hypothetical protein
MQKYKMLSKDWVVRQAKVRFEESAQRRLF